MGAATVWQALMRAPWRVLFGSWPWRALAYLVISAVLGILLIPLVVLTLLLVPLWGVAIGALERRRGLLLGFARQASGHVPLTRAQRHIWLSVRMSEGATWRETAALVIDLVLGLVALAVLFAQATVLVLLVAIPVLASTDPREIHFFADVRAAVGPDNWWPAIPLGVVALALFAYVNIVLAGSQASLVRMLCGPRPRELTRNIERLTASRAALVTAFEAERRRIERDLHDGVQQELVILGTRLGMVSLELDDLAARGSDTRPARAALEAAQGQAEHAMATLRDTVRGIHPAVLADHGLSAALDELADRTPVPIRLDVVPLGRMPAPVETAAYYLVTEAVTNTAKHTAATRVDVRARIAGDSLTVTVADDGQGGADENAGSGLRGLRERADTLGGRFDVVSPPGGPTTLHLVLPLAPPSSLAAAERMPRDAPAAR